MIRDVLAAVARVYAVAVVVATVGAAAAESPPLEEDRLLCSLSGVVRESVQLSPDGWRIVFVAVDAEGRRRVVVDGEPSPEHYDAIGEGTPLFSPDSSRLAFAARRGQTAFVVLDGIAHEAGSVDGEVWPMRGLSFGPFGEAAVWRLREGDATRLVVNGRKLEAFGDATGVDGKKSWGILGLVFEPSGRFFGFRAPKDGGMVAAVGRSRPAGDPAAPTLELSPTLASVGAYSPVSTPGRGPQSFAYIACPSPTPQQKTPIEYVSFFETRAANPASGLYDEIGRGSLLWTPSDPMGISFAARKGRQWIVVVRGKEGAAYDEVGPIVPLPDGLFFHLARKGDVIVPVLIGTDASKREELPGGEGVEHARTLSSRRGERLAYVVTQGAKSRVVSVFPGDSNPPRIETSKEYDGVDPGRVVISGDGGRIAFVAFTNPSGGRSSGEQMVVVDGVEQRSFDEVGPPLFSSSGLRVAYRATKSGKSAIIVDGKAAEVFDEVSADSPIFLPRTESVAFAARKGPTWRVYVDGEGGPEFERLVSRIEASDDGTGRVVYAARFLDRLGPVEAAVVNGRRIAEFDEIFTTTDRRIACHGDVTLFGRRGTNLARVTVGLPGVRLENLSLAEYRPGVAIHRWRPAGPRPLHLDGHSSSGIQGQGAFDAPWDLDGIRERFPGRELRFHARAGIDGRTDMIPIRQGRVTVEVHVDGDRIASSPVLTWGQSHVFDLPLPATGKLLRLVATDGGDGGQGDLTNWCDAVVVPAGRISQGGP